MDKDIMAAIELFVDTVAGCPHCRNCKALALQTKALLTELLKLAQ